VTRPDRELRAVPDGPLALLELGVVPYREAWDLQRHLVAERNAERIPDTLVLLEHPPVYTLGRRARHDHVLLSERDRATAGIDLVEVDRGGDVTYHGPGQLVAYPVVRLAGPRTVVDYVRTLEGAAIAAAAALGVAAERREGLTGVWVGREKLVAIGVRVAAGGITSHGLALNVAPDLRHFGGIVPCGLDGEGVCSLATLGRDPGMPAARRALASALAAALGADLVPAATAGLPATVTA
jgi:lipoyl(octanoyl) transferase